MHEAAAAAMRAREPTKQGISAGLPEVHIGRLRAYQRRASAAVETRSRRRSRRQASDVGATWARREPADLAAPVALQRHSGLVSLPMTLRGGRYEIIRTIASGGMAV